MRSVTILGATGSVGESAFDLLTRSGGPGRWRVIALTGGANIARLAQMARTLRARIAVTAYPELLDDLREALAGSGIDAAAGPAAIVEAADMPADWTLSATGNSTISGADFAIAVIDEIDSRGVEAALQLVEQHGGEVTVLAGGRARRSNRLVDGDLIVCSNRIETEQRRVRHAKKCPARSGDGATTHLHASSWECSTRAI